MMNHRTLTSIAAVSLFLASAVASAQAPAVPPADAPPVAAEPAPQPPAPPPAGVNKFQTTLYGFGQFDVIHDNVKVLPEGSGNTTIPRPEGSGFGPGTLGRTQMTARNSRLGFRLNAPEMGGVKAMTQIEVDFFGNVVNANEASGNLFGNLRMRHAFLKLESDLVDVIAGQTWDVFGGAVVPHLQGGLAFHGVMGEVFHRNPQLRFSKTIKTETANFEVRAAAVRPGQRDAEIPDLQAAIRFQLNNWKTVHAVGGGLPTVDGLTVDLSGMYRAFKLNPFLPPPMGTSPSYVSKTGWGLSANAFFPIIPATKENQSNALAASVSVSTGNGISDLWGINGGVTGFPNVVDAMGMAPATAYNANIDPGIVAYNKVKNDFLLINWTSFLLALQYRLPFEDGHVYVSATGSQVSSNNISELGAMGSGYAAAGLWKKGVRADVSLIYYVYPAVVLGAMYETIKETYVDDTSSARSHRVHCSAIFHF